MYFLQEQQEHELRPEKFNQHRQRAKQFIENPANNATVLEVLSRDFLRNLTGQHLQLQLDDRFVAAYLIIDRDEKNKLLIAPLTILRLSALAQKKPDSSLVTQLGLLGFFPQFGKARDEHKVMLESPSATMSLTRLLRLTAGGNYLLILQALNTVPEFGIKHLLPEEEAEKPEEPFDLTTIFTKHQEDDSCKLIANLFLNNVFTKDRAVAKLQTIKFLLNDCLIDPISICVITANLASNTLAVADKTTAALFYLESLHIRITMAVESAQAETANKELTANLPKLLPQYQAVTRLREQLLNLQQIDPVRLSAEDSNLIAAIAGRNDRNGNTVLQKLQEAGLITPALSLRNTVQQALANVQQTMNKLRF